MDKAMIKTVFLNTYFQIFLTCRCCHFSCWNGGCHCKDKKHLLVHVFTR